MRSVPRDSFTADEWAIMLGMPVPELEERVNQVIDRCFDIAHRELNITLKRPEVKYDLEGRTAGYGGAKLIRINLGLLNNPETQEEMLNVTIPHEVAHCVQYQVWPHSKAHGYQWAYVMRLFGLPPDVTHEMKTTPARKTKKFHYECGCPDGVTVGFTIHKRIQKGAAYHCKRCRRILGR